MYTTEVTRTLALARFAPARKPGYANRPELSFHTAQNQRECRRRSTSSPQRSGLLWLACALAAIWMVPAQAQTASETSAAQVRKPAVGAVPTAGVIGDSAGNPYGITPGGDTANVEMAYKLAVLYTFTGGADGDSPNLNIILGGQPLRDHLLRRFLERSIGSHSIGEQQ
jgi:hypothetical protein